jgi:hypothetical protein
LSLAGCRHARQAAGTAKADQIVSALKRAVAPRVKAARQVGRAATPATTAARLDERRARVALGGMMGRHSNRPPAGPRAAVRSAARASRDVSAALSRSAPRCARVTRVQRLSLQFRLAARH